MRRIMFALPVAALVFGSAADASAQSANVLYQVDAINEFAVSGNPAKMIVSTATAGSAPDPVSNTATTWAITTNQENRKVTGQVGAALPTGVTLEVALAKPAGTGPVSAGLVSLTTTAKDLVTSLAKVQEGGMQVQYRLSATTAAGVVAESTAVVTYTIVAGI